MFPKFSDLLNYLLGSNLDLPIQTYGFFLTMSAIAAGLILWAELKRKEKDGLLLAQVQTYRPNKPASWLEIASTSLISSLIGWKLFGIVFQYKDFAANPQQYIASEKGSVTALILIASISIVYYIYKRNKLRNAKDISEEVIVHPYQYTWYIMIVGLVFAIIGSKLFDILDNFDSFLRHPIHSLFSFSGLTFYGGFVVTVIALMIYMKIIRLDWKHVVDCTAPALMLGYAVGRMGCHLSGDGCWGIVNTMVQPHWLNWLPDWLWAYDFPHNVINRGIPITDCMRPNCMVLEHPVFPTSLYESILALFSFLILWFMRLRIKAPVVLSGLFLILNGTERFMIEKIRVNHKYDLLGLQLTQAEVISSFLILLGLFVMVYFSRKYKVSN